MIQDIKHLTSFPQINTGFHPHQDMVIFNYVHIIDILFKENILMSPYMISFDSLLSTNLMFDKIKLVDKIELSA